MSILDEDLMRTETAKITKEYFGKLYDVVDNALNTSALDPNAMLTYKEASYFAERYQQVEQLLAAQNKKLQEFKDDLCYFAIYIDNLERNSDLKCTSQEHKDRIKKYLYPLAFFAA